MESVLALLAGYWLATEPAEKCNQRNWAKIIVGEIDHFSASSRSAADCAMIASPMPGLVVATIASLGQTIGKGSLWVSIEAMKMETVLTADRDGTTKRVHAKLGDAVTAWNLPIEMAWDRAGDRKYTIWLP